jgi:hypothetical protein
MTDLLPPEHPAAPKYWRYETGGELGSAMWRYMSGAAVRLRDLALIHLYLRQWIDSPAWDRNPHLTDVGRKELADLRDQTRRAKCEPDIRRAVERMVELGMDPL